MSEQRRRKFWGWGYEGEGATADEKAALAAFYAGRFGADGFEDAPPPEAAEFDLHAPRVAPPASLAPICVSDTHERLVHACGKSYPDAVRTLAREAPHPPDVVAYPTTEDEVAAVLDWAGGVGVAVIPFGGGSSVVGGVEPNVGDGYKGTVTLDLARLDKVL